MSNKVINPAATRQIGSVGRLKKRTGLQFSMAVSYISVTVIIVLVLEILGGLATTMMLTSASFVDSDTVREAKQKAQVYALEAAALANNEGLNADITFQPGQPSSIAIPVAGNTGKDVPYLTWKVAAPQQVALLITPDKHILASTYPARYPLAAPAAQVLPRQMFLLQAALSGTSANASVTTEQGNFMGVAFPILSKEKHVLGAAYVQMPMNKPGGFILLYFAGEWFATGRVLPGEHFARSEFSERQCWHQGAGPWY